MHSHAAQLKFCEMSTLASDGRKVFPGFAVCLLLTVLTGLVTRGACLTCTSPLGSRRVTRCALNLTLRDRASWLNFIVFGIVTSLAVSTQPQTAVSTFGLT